jgi:hypothetical protein
MKSSRFNGGSKPGISRSENRHFDQPIDLSELDFSSARFRSGKKRIFTIVCRKTAARIGARTTTSILIFDNHPATLRLLESAHLNPAVATPWNSHRKYVICAFGLLVILVLMLWPLL